MEKSSVEKVEEVRVKIFECCYEGLVKAIDREDSAMVAAIAEILKKY